MRAIHITGQSKTFTLLVLAALLVGCATNGQNNYNWNDVGRTSVVEFGRVIAVRTVDITGQNTGGGATLGALGGMAAARTGDGKGQILGLILGAIAGGAVEQAISNRRGEEYTIALRNGKIVTVVQELHETDPIFAPGTRVIVQTSGQYQRVLSAAALPNAVERAKGITQYEGTLNGQSSKPAHKKTKKPQPAPATDDDGN